MRELRDPQNGCQIGQVPLHGYDFCKAPSIQLGTIRIETIWSSFQQVQQPPKVKVKRTIKSATY